MTLAYAIILPTLAVADPRPPWQRPDAVVQPDGGRLNEDRCKQVCFNPRPDRPNNPWLDLVLTEIVDNKKKECLFFCDCSWWADRGGFHNHEIREIELRHDTNKDECEEGTPTTTEINTWVQGECQDVILEGSGKVHIQTAIVPALVEKDAWSSEEGCKAFCTSATAKETAAEKNKTIKAVQYNPHRPREQYRCNCFTSDVVKGFSRPHEPNASCMVLPGKDSPGVPTTTTKPTTTTTIPLADPEEPFNAEVCVKGYTPGHRKSSTFTLQKKVQGITLEHTSGSIKCGADSNVKCKNDAWGSYERADGKQYRNLILVNLSTNKIHEATDATVGMWGGRANEKEMHFKGPFEAGKYLVSYREDWEYEQHMDNTGESCFRVFEKECVDVENGPEEDLNKGETTVTLCLEKYQAKHYVSGGSWINTHYNTCEKAGDLRKGCTDKQPETRDCCPKKCESCPY